MKKEKKMAILYKSIAEELKIQIDTYIQDGINKLPTEYELCEKYHVSRQTIRQALLLLESENLISRKQGSGIYITGKLSDPNRNKIYILISSDQDYIYPTLLLDIHSILSQNGFSEEIYTTDNRVSRETELLQSFLTNPPRGIIVEGCRSALPNPNLHLYKQLQEKGTFVISLFNRYQNFDCTYLKGDNVFGSSLLVQHLYEEGHTQIGGIFKSDDLQGLERYEGLVKSMQQLGLPILDEQIGWFNSADLYRLRTQRDTSFLKTILKEALSKCTAVICYNDEIAYWLIKELNQFGYHLPEDMAITAFDNTYLSNRGILSITTLSHKNHEIGTLVAEMAIEKAKGLPVFSQEIPFSLNIKQSTQNH